MINIYSPKAFAYVEYVRIIFTRIGRLFVEWTIEYCSHFAWLLFQYLPFKFAEFLFFRRCWNLLNREKGQEWNYFKDNKDSEGYHWDTGENERDAREQQELSKAGDFFLQGNNNC